MTLKGGTGAFDTTTQRSAFFGATSNLAASQMTKQTNTNTAIDQKRKAREKQYEKIKEYAIKFNVDEAMIYALLSEYKSMQKVPVVDDVLSSGPSEKDKGKPPTKSPMKKKKH